LPGRISCWCSTAPPTIVAATSCFPRISRCSSCRPTRPKENLWDEIREKIFKNYALKSIDAVRAKLKEAILYMERKPEIVKSITSFPHILKSL
jgi:hypothetical protein